MPPTLAPASRRTSSSVAPRTPSAANRWSAASRIRRRAGAAVAAGLRGVFFLDRGILCRVRERAASRAVRASLGVVSEDQTAPETAPVAEPEAPVAPPEEPATPQEEPAAAAEDRPAAAHEQPPAAHEQPPAAHEQP